jgi:hypothetical protein
VRREQEVGRRRGTSREERRLTEERFKPHGGTEKRSQRRRRWARRPAAGVRDRGERRSQARWGAESVFVTGVLLDPCPRVALRLAVLLALAQDRRGPTSETSATPG